MVEGGTVKLMRAPIDTNCVDCPKHLPYGVWIYYNPESEDALCIECGIKRGWMPKQRIKQLIKTLELREDIKALKLQRKQLLASLMQLKRQINIHKLGERDLVLEQQIVKLGDKVQDYLRVCGTAEEADALNKVFEVIRDTQEIQKEVREEVANRLFLVNQETEREKKKKRKTFAEVA